MKEKYIKYKGNKISIENEYYKKEFSCWIKKIEIEKGIKEYENILNLKELFVKNENKKEQKFLNKLFYDLTIMYFHCNISFPLIEISFEKEENFNSDKMIDFINRGKNRKVNFIILPSLIFNGNYLENGKSWVFTFTNNTFKFDVLMNQYLNELLNQENLTLQKIKDNLIIKVFCKVINEEKIITIMTNIDFPANIQHEFIFYLKNKAYHKMFKITINLKSFK